MPTQTVLRVFYECGSANLAPTVTSAQTSALPNSVEVLLLKIAHCLWICFSFEAIFKSKYRKGSPQSLMFLYKGLLLFYHTKSSFPMEICTDSGYTPLRGSLRSRCSTTRTSTRASRYPRALAQGDTLRFVTSKDCALKVVCFLHPLLCSGLC